MGRWTVWWCVIAGLFALLPAAGVVAEDQGELFLTDLQVMAVPTVDLGQIKVIGDQAELRLGEGEGEEAQIFAGVQTVQFGELTLELGEGQEISWNGHPEPPEDSGVEILLNARVESEAGEAATVRAMSFLQYFEPQDDGSYQLETLGPDDSPGVKLTITVQPGDPEETAPVDSDAVVLDYDTRILLLEERETIPGVGLDVGRPVMRTMAVETRLLIGLGQWCMMSGHLVEDASGQADTILLVLLRTQRKAGI